MLPRSPAKPSTYPALWSIETPWSILETTLPAAFDPKGKGKRKIKGIDQSLNSCGTCHSCVSIALP